MSKSKPTQRKKTIELTARGVFQINIAPAGETVRKKIARLRSGCAPSANGATVRLLHKSDSGRCTETFGQSFLHVVSPAEKSGRNRK